MANRVEGDEDRLRAVPTGRTYALFVPVFHPESLVAPAVVSRGPVRTSGWRLDCLNVTTGYQRVRWSCPLDKMGESRIPAKPPCRDYSVATKDEAEAALVIKSL